MKWKIGAALCVLLILGLTLGFRASTATASSNRIPYLGGNWFLMGYNYPWYQYSYDFGPGSGGNVAANYSTINGHYADMHDNAGTRFTRWFVFNDFSRAPVFNLLTCQVTGLPSNFFTNMDDAVAIARAHGIYLEPEFLDHTLVSVSNPSAACYAKIINDPISRASYFNNAVKPILQHYAGNPQILAWSTMNEPDYMTTGVACGTGFLCQTYANMQTFMSTFTNYVHTYDPGSMATINNGPMHFTHFWTGLGFDFYSPHWYNWMDQYWADTDPFQTTAASHSLDKPIVIAELPSRTAQGYTVNVTNMLNTLNTNGYAGGLFWSVNSDNVSGGVSDYAGTKAAVNAWEQANASFTDISPVQSSNLLVNGSFDSGSLSPWELGITSPATGSMALDTSTFVDGTASAKVTVTTADTTNWHVQFRQGGISMVSGHPYTLTFYVKADSSRPETVVVQQSVSPYTIYSNTNFTATNVWTKQTITFTPTVSDTVYVNFNVAKTAGNVWLDAVSFS